MRAYIYCYYPDDFQTWHGRFVSQAFVKNRPEVLILGIRYPVTLGTIFSNPVKFIRYLLSPLEEIEERIFAFTMVSFLPIKIMDRHKILGLFFGWFLALQLIAGLKIVGARSAVIWLTCVSRLPFYLKLRTFPIVYDCQDDWTFCKNKLLKWEHVTETEILNRSSAFVAVSKLTYEQKKCLAKRSFYIPQGVANHFFNNVCPLPKQLKNFFSSLARPVVGYVGNIRDWIDFELLFKMARGFPAVSFTFVGNVEANVLEQKKALGKMPNVFFLTRQDFEIIPAIVKEFDVALIPFTNNRFNLATAPYKFMEYMALGKPVLSLNIFELRAYSGLLYLYDSHEEALMKLKLLLITQENAGLSGQRINLAEDSSIDKVVEKYHKIIKNVC